MIKKDILINLITKNININLKSINNILLFYYFIILFHHHYILYPII
jgi:hypothetical protein